LSTETDTMPHTVESNAQKKWWQTATVYQIYPASFKDSNSTGVGDLKGIISEVDYIKSLGVDAIWLSPVYKSPQMDMGYDISDYRVIHEPYGTVEDIETLIAKLGENGMKLIMDLVVNHTSNEHRWFKESRSSVDNPKRDWYIWKKGTKDPKTGERIPPNNWKSVFTGSAWEYDETTDEYFFHIFAVGQPDLNWENPEVRAAVHADMDFWLEKGIGGFRMVNNSTLLHIKTQQLMRLRT
jgi:glycosidase